MALQRPVTATVVEFDRAAGLGLLRSADDVELEFHAVAITDGTRDIGVGTVVLASVAAGHAGRIEASQVTSLPLI